MDNRDYWYGCGIQDDYEKQLYARAVVRTRGSDKLKI